MSKKRILPTWVDWKKSFLRYKYEFIIGIGLLIITLLLDFVSGSYTTEIIGPHVADVILDHIGPIDLSFLFVWGYIAIIVVFFAYPAVFKPSKIHTALIMFSLLLSIRSLFIYLTHLVTPAAAIHAEFPEIFSLFRFKNDLFFSGHTAVPFLGFLIYKNKFVKYFMLVASLVMATTALLTHQHYSIDVFAAFFITYGVYKIGERIFRVNNN